MEKEKLFNVWTDTDRWELQARDQHTALSTDKTEVKPNQDVYV